MKIIIFLVLSTLSYTSKRTASDLKCLKKNKFQDTATSTKTITDSSECTSVSSQCCYINMTYNYINYHLSSQYCASLSGNIEQFKEYLNNMYQDDLYQFANYTYRNREKYKSIGRELDDDYYKDYVYYSPPTKKSYSTYLYNNCAKFEGGTCIEEKDTNYFSNFTRSYFRNITFEYCNKMDKGKCLMYNGTKSNNAMIRPLVQDIIGYLHIDEPDYVFSQDDDVVDINPDEDTSFESGWDTSKLTETPTISFDIVCPDSYISSSYISINIIIMITLSIII